MNRDIVQLMDRINEGIANLKNKTGFPVLTFKEKMLEIETAINKYMKNNQQEKAIQHLIEIYKETSYSKEGGDSFNTTIWNSNIFVSGKQTTLEDLIGQLNNIYVKYLKDKYK